MALFQVVTITYMCLDMIGPLVRKLIRYFSFQPAGHWSGSINLIIFQSGLTANLSSNCKYTRTRDSNYNKSLTILLILDQQKHYKAAADEHYYGGKTVSVLRMWGWQGVLGRCWDSLGSWRSHYHTKATLLGNLSRRCSLARGLRSHTGTATSASPHIQSKRIHWSLIFSLQNTPCLLHDRSFACTLTWNICTQGT